MTTNLAEIFNYCSRNQISLSHQQELILKIIAEHNNAIAANEILTQLVQINPKANRMTIHRALEYLISLNLIHKIQFNNTYTLCNHLNEHSCQLLVCQLCGSQIELHSEEIRQTLLKASEKFNFTIGNPLEIMGYCAQCTK